MRIGRGFCCADGQSGGEGGAAEQGSSGAGEQRGRKQRSGEAVEQGSGGKVEQRGSREVWVGAVRAWWKMADPGTKTPDRFR